MVFDNNNHSVFLLKYKLILTTIKLQPVITKQISGRLMEIFINIAPNYNITCLEWECRENCICIMFKAHPNTELSKFINAYKSAGSRLVKKEFSDLMDKLVDKQFWSKTYCLLTIGDTKEDLIRDYIGDQKLLRRKKEVKKEGNDL